MPRSPFRSATCPLSVKRYQRSFAAKTARSSSHGPPGTQLEQVLPRFVDAEQCRQCVSVSCFLDRVSGALIEVLPFAPG
jgi:hypothetical protein